jgi:hypothetical protein
MSTKTPPTKEGIGTTAGGDAVRIREQFALTDHVAFNEGASIGTSDRYQVLVGYGPETEVVAEDCTPEEAERIAREHVTGDEEDT